MNLKVFVSFLKIGFFVFGGGYAMIPFIHQEVVIKNNWLTQKEFLDSVAIGQITPGPFAITATFVGFKIIGFYGAIIATLGIFLPSVFIMYFLSKAYGQLQKNVYIKAAFKGMIPAILGMILAATANLGFNSLRNTTSFLIAILTFFIIYKFKLDYSIAILVSGILGLVLFI
jgi:chromate transporter